MEVQTFEAPLRGPRTHREFAWGARGGRWAEGFNWSRYLRTRNRFAVISRPLNRPAAGGTLGLCSGFSSGQIRQAESLGQRVGIGPLCGLGTPWALLERNSRVERW